MRFLGQDVGMWGYASVVREGGVEVVEGGGGGVREEERHFCQGLLTTGPADIRTRHGLQKSLTTSIFV